MVDGRLAFEHCFVIVTEAESVDLEDSCMLSTEVGKITMQSLSKYFHMGVESV